MYLKIIKSYRTTIAIADKEIIGKRFEEDNLILDIKESFYKGDLKTKEEIYQIIKEYSKEDATFNIVGERAINLAVEIGLIDNKGIKKINNIPYALVLL